MPGYGATREEAVYLLRVEPEFGQNLLVVFANFRGALGRHFLDIVHLNRTADRRGQLAPSTFKRNDDIVCLKLWILNDLARRAHDSVRDVGSVEDFAPVRHRL